MTADEVNKRVDQDVVAYRQKNGRGDPILADFAAARMTPERTRVTFSGGTAQECWLVTCADQYRVAYMPQAGYFALVTTSAIGPLDIGVHGGAVDCFGAV